MNKIALFILYNHNYTKNIDRINLLYKDKFSYIYHLIPFYNGKKENVIAVYESSYQFQSYICQAYQIVKNEHFSHYFIVADDMILNPSIDERNIFSFTGIDEDSSFITDLRDNSTHPYSVPLFLRTIGTGAEVKNILPSKSIAYEKLNKMGLSSLPSVRFVFSYFLHYLRYGDYKKCYLAMYYLLRRKRDYIYPAIWGYSDILLVPSLYMDDFVTFCGAFAGLNVFVEHAIPLSLCLSSSKITVGSQIKLKYITQLYLLGEKGKKEFEMRYNHSLQKLIDCYPKDFFFIHPIKLSQW